MNDTGTSQRTYNVFYQKIPPNKTEADYYFWAIGEIGKFKKERFASIIKHLEVADWASEAPYDQLDW